MSRYLLLFLLTFPFILIALVSSITRYKLGKSSKRKLTLQLILWVIALLGIIFAEPIYIWLFENELTKTEPLSLFDVVQITAIIVLMYSSSRANSMIDNNERRINDLHQELSILLSKKTKL